MSSEPPDPPGPDALRRHGHALIDWIADYLEHVEAERIQPDVAPGAIHARLPAHPPEEAEPLERVLGDLDEVVRPGLTHWQSPGWFAYFPGNGSVPSILGELAAAGLGQQGMLWATSPACTELEMRMMDWLVELLGLPDEWKTTGPGGGVIQTTASEATHVALVAARDRARGPERAVPLERLVAYGSSQAHSSLEKGARIAGFDHVRAIDVDDAFAMRPDALAEAIEADAARGLSPTFVCSTVGTTGTTAIDPVRRVGELARAHGLWHHVDAAYAGTAMLCEELRPHQDGLELADSYVFNPHKWMGVGFDCSCFYVADRRPLLEAMSIVPPYLRADVSEDARVFDYRDWHVALGRRFRALKLWFVLRAFGAEGIRARVRAHVRLARELASKLEADPRFSLVAPVPFALVCFRHAGGPEATRALGVAIDATGHSRITPSEIEGAPFLRVSVGQITTEARHVERLWQAIDALA
ncbi:MAG TPA: pyridoxal-dependent decarboxylase [Sandaracinaceae bacterium LLY-WYZ-13_1]|nr:pyridoxal-dependent decarboxylase [Sandaracinaceae bacterium LLY-WYZ-13_1]